MPITENELRAAKAPFKVRADKDGTEGTVIGFSDNDPLGVGGGIFPDMPTAHFEGGGWVLIQDLMNHQTLVSITRGLPNTRVQFRVSEFG